MAHDVVVNCVERALMSELGMDLVELSGVESIEHPLVLGVGEGRVMRGDAVLVVLGVWKLEKIGQNDTHWLAEVLSRGLL